MRYDVDNIGNVRGLYTQILQETPEGMVMADGPEDFGQLIWSSYPLGS